MLQLYDYQQDMLERIKAAFCSHQSVMVQMPTGTGKTHVLAAVVEAFVGVQQKKVWIVAHRHELIEQIEAILEKYDIGEKTALVEVMSIQWLSRHYREMEDEPGLIVIDEAHHAPAGSYAEIMRAFPKTKKLGVTATPCRLNGRGFTDLFELMLESWSVNRFIAEERLCDAVLQHASGKKGIVYAIDIQHADHITEYYRAQGIKATSISCTTAPDERAKLLTDFKEGRIEVLVNVDLFGEEFDCPVEAKQYKNGQWVTVESRVENGKVIIEAPDFTSYGLFLGVSFSTKSGSEAISFTQNKWDNLYGSGDMKVGSATFTYKVGTEITTKGTTVLTALLVEKLAQKYGAKVASATGTYPINVTLPIGTMLSLSGIQEKITISASANGKSVSGTQYGTVTVVAATANRQHTGGSN